MRKVSADEWADFCSDYRNRSREYLADGVSVMEQVAPNGLMIARVVYGETKTYEIYPENTDALYRVHGTKNWNPKPRFYPEGCPEAVQRALLHVRDYHPEVDHAVFTCDGRHLYISADGVIPKFGAEVDQSILEEADDAVGGFPAIYCVVFDE